ncbi:ATP-dependent DNA helicase RecG [Dictyobacter formicarum]|uniref:ATP-dependent DNA helicase RecG n=1 Tax=Dictyobacter formicarum TaxID=2778368 RepID=A0ABQ3VND4_9CHLR|nr:ATP-dependent DNA helicase RecG [Dictyobacter formicarum]GHO87755.1 ATP-dependent DNA helicase RecG [Dictyobacter formicarum]
MSNSNTATLTTYIERARKVLQHEQRTNHQDQAIKPGGVEAFTARWYSDTSALCQSTGQDAAPLQRFTEYLHGYHQQDPIQRAANLRAALAILNEIETAAPGTSSTSQTAKKVVSQRPAANKPVSQREQKNTEQRKAAVPPPTKTSPVARPAATNSKPTTTLKQARPKETPQNTPNPIRLEAGMSQGHTALTLLSADITAIPGVGPTVATRLRSLGLRTVRDLLFYFPREHRDYSQLTKITDVPFNEVTTTMGLIWDVEMKRTGNGRTRTIATISDETGKLYVSWFNQPYLQKQLQAAHGTYLVVTGVKQRFGNKVEFAVRSHELPEQGDLLNTGRMVPIYPLTEGLSAKALRRFTKYVVDRYAKMVPDYLPVSIQSAGRLMMLSRAIEQIHYPDNEELRASAHHRLAFDELFMLQLGMQERRARWQHEAKDGNAFTRYDHRIFLDSTQVENQEKAAPGQSTSPLLGSTLWSVIATDKPFEGTLPFSFTAAQKRVINEIFRDLTKSKPMCRLLQGDVGAGKTAVAAASLLLTALNGYQGAIMAPTELLAEQHARSISVMLEPFGVQTVLLTGSQRQRERNLVRQALESGQAAVAIGTHALIQDDVNFHSLGLVIVDEQHRFGVEQRDALRQKGLHPHMLVMTATPIPRTLALTLYGDLDVSVIDQLPPGRQKIITRWRTGTRRNEAYTQIAHQVAEGRQAFIICPLIEESESLSAKAATSEYERLQREVFPNLRVGLLHGAMKPTEKDQIMHSFRDHELDILVATSVIEVGIDIPNATVMVIEDADRFGLSQLHQFRGRVGRGKHQSYCYVLSAEASIQAQERLGVFQDTDDGFKLSEEDLRLRGPGDFIGVRQSGMPELRIADFSDTALIEQARSLAEQLWQSDPYLRKPEHAPLRERMYLFWQNFMPH